jgi:cytochrome c
MIINAVQSIRIAVNPDVPSRMALNCINLIQAQVDFRLNGYNVVSFEIHTDAWKKMVAASKFKDMPGFGLAKKGHISLQDHGDKVWFRNIKIREVK